MWAFFFSLNNFEQTIDVVVEIMTIKHTLLTVLNAFVFQVYRLNLCTPELDQLITQYCSIPGVIAAKISGSGLGDCVVMLGTFPKEAFNSREDNIAIRISDEGVKLL